MKYRKKPVIIEAFRFDGSTTSANEILTWMETGKEPVAGGIHTRDLRELEIPTLEDGTKKQVKHIATAGDYIIKGIQGEFYPCKPDIFEKTYEAIE